MSGSSPRPLHVPALGFALTMGAALWVALGAGAAPAAELHETASAYLDAVYAGNRERIAAYHAPDRYLVGARGGLDLRGRSWIMTSLELREGGQEGEVAVAWMGARGRAVLGEAQVWRRDAAGAWRLWSVDDLAMR